MRGYPRPRRDDLPSFLADLLDGIYRRLEILERPTGTQMDMTVDRVKQHKTWLDDHQVQLNDNRAALETEKGRNDAQWTAIDGHTAQLADHQSQISTNKSGIASVNGRADALWTAVNTEKGRNDAQWTAINAAQSKADSAASAASSAQTRADNAHGRIESLWGVSDQHGKDISYLEAQIANLRSRVLALEGGGSNPAV